MSLRSSFLLVLASATAPVACSNSNNNMPPPPQPPYVRFVAANAVPNYMDVPFPTDAYLVNGTIGTIPNIDAIVTVNASMLTNALSVHDGWGRVAWSEFYVDDPTAMPESDGSIGPAAIDTTTLPQVETDCQADASSVFLIDLEATGMAARMPCRATYHVAPLGHTRPVLGVGPARGIVLAPSHKYAAVVTTRVKTKAGVAIASSTDFATIASGNRSAPLGPLYGGALDTVNGLLGGALGTDKVVGLAVFTTNNMQEELYGLRDQLETMPAATLAWDATSMAPMGATKFTDVTPLPTGFTASLDAWLGVATQTLPDGTDDPDANLPVRAHDAIETIGTAVFDAINYLHVSSMGYVDPNHANFARDAMGNIIPAPEQPTAKIWVTFFVPKTTMPQAGYPVVIVQHGLSSTRHYSFELANTFCKNGWMVAAIDSVTFGARAPEPMYQVDQVSLWASAPGATYNGPDGLADPVNGSFNGSGDFFGNLLNIGAIRDQLRQAEFDTAQLVKVLRSNPNLSALQTGASAPAIDPSHVAYMGDSLGGIEGAAAAAIEPNVNAWTLNVAGGGIITELADRSPVIGLQLNAGGLNFGFSADQLTEAHPLVTLFQTIVEPGDPLLYASGLVTAPHPLMGNATKPRNFMQVEVLFDELVGNESAEALARAAGIGMATPNVGSNSEIPDIKNPTMNPHAIAFAQVMPDSNGIHDTPMMGTTAVLVQADPGTHSDNMVASTGGRTYKAPWPIYDTLAPFPLATHPYTVRCPYRSLQIAMAGFFGSAFMGQTPTIQGFQAPVRDLDDDGNPDATDPDPNDPLIH